MKLNLTLISILLFIIIILITFILNNNLEKFIIVQNTDNNKITDTITLPIPEISQVCTGNDCTDILWHKDCNGESYFDSECRERRTDIFDQGKTVSGRDCHLVNITTGCCEDQGGNGCNCDSLGKTISNVGCGCGISKINGCCPGITKDCSGTCGGNKRLNDCNQCKENGESTKQSNGCCPGETDVGCGCNANGQTINKESNGCCPEETDVGCGCDSNGQTINKESNGCCPGISKDCSGVCGGTSVIDQCGVCGGDGLSCIETPPQSSQEADSPTATKYINDDCSENSDCYSGICTYKTGEKWPFVKGKTCDGRPYGSPCTDYSKHCIYGHQCRDNTCGPISMGYECNGINDDRCQEGSVCIQDGVLGYYCGVEATKKVGQNCSKNSDCYSGICTYKPPVGWLSEKTTCDGKAYGQPCTNAKQHCQNGHKCENGTCGPIKRNWYCDGAGDDRCESGTSCQWYRYDATWLCR